MERCVKCGELIAKDDLTGDWFAVYDTFPEDLMCGDFGKPHKPGYDDSEDGSI